MVRPGRQQMFAVGTLADFGRGARHAEVLEELDAPADGGVALGQVAPGALPEPFRQRGAGGEGVDPGLGLQHVHIVSCCLANCYFVLCDCYNWQDVLRERFQPGTFGSKIYAER